VSACTQFVHTEEIFVGRGLAPAENQENGYNRREAFHMLPKQKTGEYGIRPYGIATPFAFSACRSCWQNMKHALKALNQISSLSMQSGNARGFPGGTPGRVFLVRSLPRGKE
jgi:hypothetical protein